MQINFQDLPEGFRREREDYSPKHTANLTQRIQTLPNRHFYFPSKCRSPLSTNLCPGQQCCPSALSPTLQNNPLIQASNTRCCFSSMALPGKRVVPGHPPLCLSGAQKYWKSMCSWDQSNFRHSALLMSDLRTPEAHTFQAAHLAPGHLLPCLILQNASPNGSETL